MIATGLRNAPDTTSPQIVSLSPVDNAIDVDPATHLTVEFNEPVVPGMGTVRIYDAEGVEVEAIDIQTQFSQFTFSGDGRRVTINPSIDLLPGDYSIRLTTGLFKDTANNPSALMAGTRAWSFSTGAAVLLPPTMTPESDSNLTDDWDTGSPIALSLSTSAPGEDALFASTVFASTGQTINFSKGEPGATWRGSKGMDLTRGTSGNDVYNLADGNDRSNGRGGNDQINGGSGNDRLRGGSGDDELNGASGNDFLVGGEGNDVLIGGTGKDRLMGGSGRDRFVYGEVAEGDDKIRGFNPAQDVLDLRDIFTQPGFGSDRTSAPLSQFIRLERIGSHTQIQVDLDGKGVATTFVVLVTLQGIQSDSITARNFVIA
ncbi:Ig-like domain-containing protein [Leptolyngbya ohadii]|uniref:Ig-like domain-containing protein n=1 Tax=Leptolyngbya ohadii TaxID=1962290 RepID=UPI000B59CD10|nr:Ig-like domain-containing protein [Leptolyngbya ohadii]